VLLRAEGRNHLVPARAMTIFCLTVAVGSHGKVASRVPNTVYVFSIHFCHNKLLCHFFLDM